MTLEPRTAGWLYATAAAAYARLAEGTAAA